MAAHRLPLGGVACFVPGSPSHRQARYLGRPCRPHFLFRCLQPLGPDARFPLPVAQPAQALGPREMSSWPHWSPLTQGSSSSILLPPSSRAWDFGSKGAVPQMGLAEAMARSGVSQPVGSALSPPSLFRCLSRLRGLKFWSNQTLPQSAPLPARQCQPIPGCLVPQAASGHWSPGPHPSPSPGWGCPRGHSLSLSSLLSFPVFNLLLQDAF